MDNDSLKSIIDKVRQGILTEETHLDLKREWWDFQTKLDEFIKDICSMANTQSGDSYIILGLGEDGILQDAPLPFDEAIIQQKHKDKVDPRIHIQIFVHLVEGKKISLIKIPHSNIRPHVIKKYKNHDNYIPIRFGTTILAASKTDLDEMYSERNKYEISNLKIDLKEKDIRWDNFAGYSGPSFLIRLVIDNLKSQTPDHINEVILYEKTGEHWKGNNFKFEGLALNEEFRIDQNRRYPHVIVYVSDQFPGSLHNPRKMPDFDKDSLVLKITTVNSKVFEIPIKSGWINDKY